MMKPVMTRLLRQHHHHHQGGKEEAEEGEGEGEGEDSVVEDEDVDEDKLHLNPKLTGMNIYYSVKRNMYILSGMKRNVVVFT